MTDTPTTGLRVRDQETGTNLSTWGDNTDANWAIIDRKLTNLETYVVSATTQTVSYTDYSSTNPLLSANIWLTGNSGDGTFTSGSTITMPSLRGSWSIYNQTGSTIIFKTSTGVSVSVYTGTVSDIASNGTDFYHVSPTSIPNYKATLTNASDIVVKTTMESAIATAIAAAALTASGQVLATVADTTPGYLDSKLSVSGSLTKSTTNPGANEVINISFQADEGQAVLQAGVLSV